MEQEHRELTQQFEDNKATMTEHEKHEYLETLRQRQIRQVQELD